MHSSDTPKPPFAINPCSSAASAPEDRPSAPRLRLTKEQRLERADGELAAYFERKHDAAPRCDEDDAVEATLASIPAYHRGVLRLYHGARTWSDAVKTAFGRHAAIAIRLDCVDHPAVGPTATLEQAAAERIAAIVAAEGDSAPRLIHLCARAMTHHERALRAYVKALSAM